MTNVQYGSEKNAQNDSTTTKPKATNEEHILLLHPHFDGTGDMMQLS